MVSVWVYFFSFLRRNDQKKRSKSDQKQNLSLIVFFPSSDVGFCAIDASSMKETLQISFDFCFSNTQTPEERSSSRPARDGCCGVKARTDVLPVHFGVRCARLTASKGRFWGANAQRRDDANVALFWFVFWSRFFSSLWKKKTKPFWARERRKKNIGIRSEKDPRERDASAPS